MGMKNMILEKVLSSKPPLTNRGVNCALGVAVGIDWFQGTFASHLAPDMISVFDRWLPGAVIDPQAVGFRGLSHLIGWDNGARVCWGPEQPWGYLCVPGRFFDCLDQLSSSALLCDLLGLGLKLTRIDVFRDDYRKLFHPSEFKRWADDGRLFGKRVYGYTESFDGRDRGSTFYAGSRGDSGCGSFARYYDKSQHSKDRDDCYRLEIEFSGKKASIVGGLLLESVGLGLDRFVELLDGLALGQFSFSAQSRHERERRRVVSPEWSAYSQCSDPIKVSVRKKSAQLSSTINAFKVQWGGFLGGLSFHGLGLLFGVLCEAVQDGAARGFKSSFSRDGSKISRPLLLSSPTGELEELVRRFRPLSPPSLFVDSFLQRSFSFA